MANSALDKLKAWHKYTTTFMQRYWEGGKELVLLLGFVFLDLDVCIITTIIKNLSKHVQLQEEKHKKDNSLWLRVKVGVTSAFAVNSIVFLAI